MTEGPVLGLGGRLRKLRAMSGAEVAHRLWYRALLTRERRQHRARPIGAAGSHVSAHLLEARRGKALRFLPSLDQRDAIRELFATRYASERAAAATNAADTRAHRFAFFGQVFEYGDEIPWQSDPVTGRAWPAVYHADVPVHGGDVGYGDVKHVWELSRQQFLIDLGKAWFLFGNDDDLAALGRLVRSWIASNPYGTGVNWACALEPAFRVFSWLWAYGFTAQALDDELHRVWLGSLHDHGRFIERHLEHYSSPYNHLIAEAAALYMLGACFPEMAGASRWQATGKAVMTRRLGEQFYEDGGSVEQSTFYHHATVGFYLLAGLTARATGDDLAPEIWRAIERGLDFSMTLGQPDGFTPALGGADDGKPIRMEHLPFWDFRPYLAAGAVVFGRADYKTVAGRFHEDALWLTGVAGLEAFDALPATAPAYTSKAIPASGYYVMRTGWTPADDYVCVDCGEQAAGMRQDAVPNSMHGHADCLSIVVSLGGKRTLVDSGLYAYNCGGEWEAHFRETAALNTARVDGRDQARHIRKMAWSHSYRATPEAWRADGEAAWFVGSHDGYARGPEGIRHRRTVWLRPASYVVVLDELEGPGVHDFEVNYQFAPGTLALAGDGRALFDDRVELLWVGDQPWSPTVSCGGPGPADGWIAPSLGIRTPAPRLSLRRRSGGHRTSLLAVLALRETSDARVRLLDAPAGQLGRLIAVGSGAVIDVVAGRGLSDGSPIVLSDTPLAVCRLSRDSSRRVTACVGVGSVDAHWGDLEHLLGGRAPATEDRG
jgi:hypothetical protein